MNAASTSNWPVGRFYVTRETSDGLINVELVERPLVGADLADGVLVGSSVVVITHAVLVSRSDDGSLIGVPVPALGLHDDTLCFDPSTGGMRTRENRRAAGAFNAQVQDANAFGMVNAFVHTERAAGVLNGLLADLGVPSLPRVRVVVGAHFGSKLPGYAQGDGDRWSASLRPLSGGHYRVSQRTTGVAEPFEVWPTGEIHLGPSRYRKPYAESLAYLRNAAHNPAIIYHEYGHHLCRHTADFRLNAEREPAEQRNGKPAIEEAVCDYFAAALLDTGRPYGWYRADRGARRDPEVLRHAADVSGDDPHAHGAPWAAALWRSRQELVERGLIEAPVDHDRAVVDALVRVGKAYGPDRDGSQAARERRRSRPRTFARELRRALRDAGSSAAGRAATRIFEAQGLLDPDPRRSVSC